MKKPDLGQSISILANVGVIAGLVFLAVELQQNNALLAAQARSELAARRTGFLEMVVQSPDLADIVVKAGSSEPLTPGEQIRFSQLGRRMIASWESLFLEVDNGVFPQTSLPVKEWRGLFFGVSGPDYQLNRAWEAFKPVATPQFVVFMEQEVVGAGPP